MKKIFILTVVALLAASCFKDKGNYDYTDIGEVKIEGISSDTWYEGFAFSDTLKIPVTITSDRYTHGEQPYTYQWKLESVNAETMDGDAVLDYTVSREKDLNIVPSVSAGDYYGFYIVTDTILGLATKVDFFVRLRTTVSDGWMVLCEENGKTRLDWIICLNDTSARVSRDIWKDADFNPGKPYGIDNAYAVQAQNRYVFAEQGTYNIDYLDAHIGEDNNVRWSFGNLPANVNGISDEIAYRRTYRLDMLVTKDYDMYSKNPTLTGAIYGFPMNVYSNGDRFDIAPYYGHANAGYNVSVIMYDMTNKQFVEFKDEQNPVATPVTFAGGSASFDAYTGRDIVYMNWTKDGYAFAVLQDPSDHEYYLYGIKLESSGQNFKSYYCKIPRLGSETMEKICFHSTFRYMFYSCGSDVYQFDIDNPTQQAKKVLSFPGETITTLVINKFVAWYAYQTWERTLENELVVGSIDNSKVEHNCGNVRLYDVPSLMAPLELKRSFSDLGKIVDIAYREKNNNGK